MFNPKTKAPQGKDQPAAPPATPQPAPVVARAPEPAAAPVPKPENYLSPATVIEGNVVTGEVLRLDGKVKGDIRTTARLFLGQESLVEGNISAVDAEVAGRIQGTIECRGLLTIKSTCVIDGDIVTRSLNVESGSSFNGRCKVGEASNAPSALADDDKPMRSRVKAQAAANAELAIH